MKRRMTTLLPPPSVATENPAGAPKSTSAKVALLPRSWAMAEGSAGEDTTSALETELHDILHSALAVARPGSAG